MSHEPIARKAMREAERGAPEDVSRLVDAVPALMREAARRRSVATAGSPSLAQPANWALPRLAAATAIAVVAATVVVVRDRGTTAATPKATTMESVILDGGASGTGDVVFDALLGTGRNDG
jgi:hypothetical protein